MLTVPQLVDTDLRPQNGVDKQQQLGLQMLVRLLGLALLRQQARQLLHKWDNGAPPLVEVNNNGAQQLELEANSDTNKSVFKARKE